MNIILLSGGSGKRLWPLSNDVRSKQFLKVFKTESGDRESMVQRVYRQIRTVDPEAKVTIATSREQAPSIYEHLGENVGISVEPCRRDTFPAIALASAYLADDRRNWICGGGCRTAGRFCVSDSPCHDICIFEFEIECKTDI